MVSRDFIHSKAWNWLFKTKCEANAEGNFCTYILSEIEDSIKTVKLYFPIVNLNLKVPFKIGQVEFSYFTSQYFDKYIEEYARLQPDKENVYVGLKRHYKGTVYVATTVSAEAKKAEEIALEICSLSMDVLKICSYTLDFPFAKIDFDIDRRSNYNPQSEVIVESSDFISGLKTGFRRPAYPYMLDQIQFEHIKLRKLEIFNSFISQISNNKSELEMLVIQGIQRLANALSNQNYFQRITELFTILESLLLINEDSPIIETVSKYSSKLITQDKENRKLIIKVLREMYKVRSSWIHHAKEKHFEMDDLKRLQQIVHELLHSLISKTKVHSSKLSLLDEIDDAILGAY